MGNYLVDVVELQAALGLVEGDGVGTLNLIVAHAAGEDGVVDGGAVAVEAGLLVEADAGDDGEAVGFAEGDVGAEVVLPDDARPVEGAGEDAVDQPFGTPGGDVDAFEVAVEEEAGCFGDAVEFHGQSY